MVARQIKVIQLLPELEEGGVEQGTLELGNYLAEKGHISKVISQGGRMVAQLEEEGSIHFKWKYFGEKSPRALVYIPLLRQLLLKEKPDILHLSSRLPAWIGYLAYKSLPIKRRPRLVTAFHGFHSINKYSAVMTKGEMIVAVSNTIAEHIKKKYGVKQDSIIVIYRGFDERTFNPDIVSDKRVNFLRHQWGLTDAKLPIILLPARLTSLKGHDLLLKSLVKVRQFPWTVVFAGDINEKSTYTLLLMDMVHDLKMENRVIFAGHCSDMPAAMKLADIIISASKSPESFGRVAVEAQAMGKPVIVSSHGGSLETVCAGKTGWMFKPGDVDSLAKVLKEVILDKKMRHEFGKSGQKWVKENFTTAMMCERILILYQNLLCKNLRTKCS